MSAAPAHPDSFKSRKTLTVGAKTYQYFSLPGCGEERAAPASPTCRSL